MARKKIMQPIQTLPIKKQRPIAVGLHGLVSVPVEVWWGLEWVKAESWQEDERTILARLKTRTGETRMCRIRNINGVTMWRHADDKPTNGVEEKL